MVAQVEVEDCEISAARAESVFSGAISLTPLFCVALRLQLLPGGYLSKAPTGGAQKGPTRLSCTGEAGSPPGTCFMPMFHVPVLVRRDLVPSASVKGPE